MLVAGKVIFSLFICVLIAIIIEKTVNYLTAQKVSKDNIYSTDNRYYYNDLDDFYYTDDETFHTEERINMSHINEENDQLINKL